MSSLEITAKQREAYCWGRQDGHGYVVYVLADALQAQFAARLKAEFYNRHDALMSVDGIDEEVCAGCYVEQKKIPAPFETDPRHNWTDAEWLVEADRRLREP